MDEYEELLDRAYENLPKEMGPVERFELPDPDIFQQGNKTIIRNFADLCSAMRRDPKVVAKFLSKEVAAPYNLEGRKVSFIGKVNPNLLKTKILDFVERFVKCKVCGRYDTHFEDVSRNIKMVVCEACGAKTPVRL